MSGMETAGLSHNIEELHQQLYAMSEEIRVLKEHLFLATRRQFGAQSEGFSPDQLELLNTGDVSIVVTEEIEEPDDKEDKKPKPRATRQAVVVGKDTPVILNELDLDDQAKQCDCCGTALHKIGEDCTYQAELIPAQTRLIKTVRPKYGCRGCDSGIKQAPLPASPIPKSMATPSLLSYLIIGKYVDHQPLNRLEKSLKRHGIYLPRSTQSDWMLASAALLKPLTQLMRGDLLTSPQIFTDDTILPLQNDIKGRNKLIQARLWVYASQSRTGPPMVLYDFTRSREKAGPHTFLAGYDGYIQADAYSGYDGLYLAGAKEVACMAHCRRYFFEASELELSPGPAHDALAFIRQLYKIERNIKVFTHKKRKKQRRLKAKPILKKMYRWLKSQQPQHLPKGKYAKAINYALNHWAALTRYCEAGYLEIDNNYSEREMRPIALGRKNYLFAGSERGGNAAATLYSLVESAKVNSLNVAEYLTDILTRIPAIDGDELHDLLPYRWQPKKV